MKLKNNEAIRNAFLDLLEIKTEDEKIEHDSRVISIEFISIIQTHLIEHKITKKELAKKINSSPSYITQVLRGDKTINMRFLAKIQKALGIKFKVCTDEELSCYKDAFDEKSHISSNIVKFEEYKIRSNYRTADRLKKYFHSTEISNIGGYFEADTKSA